MMRVVIVGAGLMGYWHARYAVRAGAAVVAIVDHDASAATRLARNYPAAAVFTTLPAALAVGNYDVVHICTPLETHVPLAELALAAGCHIIGEKPLAPTLAETQSLLDQGRECKRLVCAVHQFPFQRGVRWLLSHRTRLGELIKVEYRTCSAGGDGLSAARRQSVMLEILPHPISLFHVILQSKITDLHWKIDQFTSDDLSLSARLGTTQLSIDISLRARPTRNEITLFGTQASAVADLFHGYSVLEPGRTGRLHKVLFPLERATRLAVAASGNLLLRVLQREPAYPGLRQLLNAYYASITLGRPSPVETEELLAVAELFDSSRKSICRIV